MHLQNKKKIIKFKQQIDIIQGMFKIFTRNFPNFRFFIRNFKNFRFFIRNF